MTVINILIAVIALSLSGIVGYWAQDRSVPISDYTAEVLNPVVAPGEMLKIRHRFVRQRICHVKLEQLIYDFERTRIIIPIEDFVAAPGPLGQEDFATTVRIPNHAADGPARYRAIRIYTCNPLQELFGWPIVLVFPDVTFTIRRP